MSPLEYHRPKNLQEAIALLQAGVPLAGGTALVPQRRRLQAVIDLSHLGLDGFQVQDGRVTAGATLKLQALAEAGPGVPPALAQAVRLEATRNLRSMVTLGGALMACDGRSPLVTALLALGAQAAVHPGGGWVALTELLAGRGDGSRWLVTALRWQEPVRLAYDQVARTPADRPILCAAVARAGDGSLGVALGGHGAHPRRIADTTPEEAPATARRAYAQAEDEWASAAYRAAVAEILVRRLVAEVAG